MNLDANALLASLLVSSIGFVLFVYGRRMRRIPQLAVGLVMLIYPYFVSSVWLMLAIAAVLLSLLWFGVKQGL
jgi:hypothetical protein